jgi:predicted transcriptional regulator
MTRRSQVEIYIDILKAVAEGKKKPTHIMYRANLSWIRLKKYLDFLIRQNLLVDEENDGGMIFTLTTKGKDVIGYFKRIESELNYTKKIISSEVYCITNR